MSSPEADLTGGCLCGAVRYALPDDFAYAVICHCSQCRRATGALSKPLGGIRRERFRVTEGEGNLLRWGDDTTFDIRCATCGSPLWSQVRDGAWVHVSLGTLDRTPSKTPTAHIHVASKADWEVLPEDGLPRQDGF